MVDTAPLVAVLPKKPKSAARVAAGKRTFANLSKAEQKRRLDALAKGRKKRGKKSVAVKPKKRIKRKRVKRTAKKSTRRSASGKRVTRRKRVARPSRIGVASQRFAPGVDGASRTSLSLPTPGFSPIPLRATNARNATPSTVGARKPSLNGETYNGQRILPRVVDGQVVDIRNIQMPTKRQMAQ